MISCYGASAYLDYAVFFQNRPIILSFYNRSLIMVKSICASLNLSSLITMDEHGDFKTNGLDFDIFIQPFHTGKEKCHHAYAIVQKSDQEFLTTACDASEDFYHFLMKQFNLPLMKEWKEELLAEALSSGLLRGGNANLVKGAYTGLDPEHSSKLERLMLFRTSASESDLNDMVTALFRQGRISITMNPQKKLEFSNMDSYFKKYGASLVENLKNSIQPLTELDGTAKDFTLKELRLFPQQIAQVNGQIELFQSSSYGIMNHGMGSGKTICTAAIIEGYFARKWVKSHPGKTLKDLYSENDSLQYRVVIMCPGHLQNKWRQEIIDQIPYACVEIITNMEQLLLIWKNSSKRKGRQFLILSKDFSKLSYQYRPSPRKRRHGIIKKKYCSHCEKEVREPGRCCPSCDKTLQLSPSPYKGTGMVCPHCNSILLPYRNIVNNAEEISTLDHIDFAEHVKSNSSCYYCGEELWEPHVANLGAHKKNVWHRATHWRNMAHKGTKTVWVHEDHKDEYFMDIQQMPLNMTDTNHYKGVRKFAPAQFIKKHMRNFFDFAVFDEAHQYKGGATGQGHAMHALVKASKKQLALTGTIAGGYADDIYYLLYRLDPGRMKKHGFDFANSGKFAIRYGRIEREFSYHGASDDAVIRQSCKGKQIGRDTVKPGISPLVFTDYLLDKTTFLDLSDMSRHLPPLKEKVVLVNMDGDEVFLAYQRSMNALRKQVPSLDGGRAILSTILQLGLSYLDKPYGVGSILSPKTGAALLDTESFLGNAYNFPTIIFYQLGTSLFTIWQASRRHHRLNQRDECRTYYLAVKGSLQQAVLQLIAEKQAATSAASFPQRALPPWRKA